MLATTAPAAAIMVTIVYGYKNGETAAHYCQEESEKDQTNVLYHGFFPLLMQILSLFKWDRYTLISSISRCRGF